MDQANRKGTCTPERRQRLSSLFILISAECLEEFQGVQGGTWHVSWVILTLHNISWWSPNIGSIIHDYWKWPDSQNRGKDKLTEYRRRKGYVRRGWGDEPNNVQSKWPTRAGATTWLWKGLRYRMSFWLVDFLGTRRPTGNCRRRLITFSSDVGGALQSLKALSVCLARFRL